MDARPRFALWSDACTYAASASFVRARPSKSWSTAMTRGARRGAVEPDRACRARQRGPLLVADGGQARALLEPPDPPQRRGEQREAGGEAGDSDASHVPLV